ncbi:MAG: HEAT repeat domain-containing protein [Myxococcales bacterium]|nr:HEAT repeat domain-containing protein [Myxococcales bacterium]
MVRRTTARRASRLVVAFLALAALSARGSIAVAQSARASFLLQMLRSNPDARVRTNAALRLGELREADTVAPIVEILNAERDLTVQATIIAALATIGDARALPAVQQATRSPSRDVQTQARRALTMLQAAAARNTGTTNNGGTQTPTSSATPVVLISAGRVNLQSGVPSALQSTAQRALESALDARGEVVRHSGSSSQATSTMRARRLRGAHQFDANIQSVTQQANGVRVAVSIVVSTYPGRAYEFDSSSAVTVSGGGGDPQQGAISTAMNAAVNRALTQVLSTTR